MKTRHHHGTSWAWKTWTRRIEFALSCVTAMVLAPANARAETISISSPFLSTASNPLAQIAVYPFDTALGTLDSVDVAVSGSMFVSVDTPSNPLPLPTPYAITVQLIQDFFGVGGLYFDFNGPALF